MTAVNERSYDYADKSEWGDGPWQTEPDKIVWVDEATGFDCMIIRNRIGSFCGYVGVSEGHPWHGIGYDDVDADVHGGLTFADKCQPGMTESDQDVCHTVMPGRPENVWWLGFDTAHAGDLSPGMQATERKMGIFPTWESNYEYRHMGYVRSYVESLARQARTANSSPESPPRRTSGTSTAAPDASA